MSAELLRDLARAKATFQMRSVLTVMGVNPDVAFGDGPCARGLWPREVLVSPRAVRGPHIAPVGVEEGDLCMRDLCQGALELRRSLEGEDRGCTCFLSAPCGTCMSVVPECPVCGHREEEPT